MLLRICGSADTILYAKGKERKMEFAIKQAEFVTSAGLGSPYPEKTAAEIAIVASQMWANPA